LVGWLVVIVLPKREPWKERKAAWLEGHRANYIPARYSVGLITILINTVW
jgi:hypothetical protein